MSSDRTRTTILKNLNVRKLWSARKIKMKSIKIPKIHIFTRKTKASKCRVQ